MYVINFRYRLPGLATIQLSGGWTRCFLCVLLALLDIHSGKSQNPHPYFRNYTTEHGLPSPEVHYCLEDDEGYMWLATDNGLSRFDGYEFRNYGPREGLRHNVIFYLQKDPEGRIWAATMHGHLYYADNDSIRAFAQNLVIERLNPGSRWALDFFIDGQGVKYLSLQGIGILQFSPEGAFTLHTPESPKCARLALKIPGRWIMSNPEIRVPKKGEAKTAPQDSGYTKLEVIADSNYQVGGFYFRNAAKSSTFWIKTLNNHQTLAFNQAHLYGLEEKKIAWRHPFPYSVQHKTVCEEADGQLLIGLQEGGGIRRYQSIEKLRERNYEQYLKGISVTHIFRDSRGAYWIGSIENGLFYCPDFDLRIYDQSAGLPADYVAAFDFKNEKELYVGLRNGQALLVNTENNRIKTLPAVPGSPIVYDVLFDRHRQELWLTNGRPRFFRHGRWAVVKRQQPGGAQEYVFSKKMNWSRGRDSIWGAHHSGFGCIGLERKVSSVISSDLGLSDRVFSVWEGRQGRVWVGKVNGLFEFKNDQLIRPAPFQKKLETRIEDISELPDGTLALATKGEGVLLWKQGLFHQLTTSEGLSSDMIENIHVDGQGRIWAGTLQGLNRITRQGSSYRVEAFTTFHGLPSNEISQVRSFGSQTWIATSRGLMQWHEKTGPQFTPEPIIEKVLANNSRRPIQGIIRLSHKENHLEFRYLSINYNMNGKIPYRFRLNGEEWNQTYNRSVNFANLAPGSYQFEVQAQNENQVWSNSGTVFFEIQPAFWQTRWFTALWVGVLLGLVGLFYRSRLRRIRRASEVEREMNQLKLSALRAQMNPHFIFNCLNSIQNFITQNDQRNAIRYLAKFAQLVRGVLHVSMKEKISLTEEVQILENYLNLEKLRFKEKFDYRLHVDEQLDLFEVALPPLLAQPFVENAILHGFAQKEKGGLVEIDFRQKDGGLEIEIRDNGIGIFQSQDQKRQSGARHKSVGVSISRRRLEIADKLNAFEVKEIIGDDGEIQGTSVRMFLQGYNC
ncbi:MAG: histidine kinase [Phaeodactylibacter sp.]|nr:histidine kinase [Phaeodactylibacter sp.]